MDLEKEKIRDIFNQFVNVKITSIERLDEFSYIFNNTYKITKINPLTNNFDDIKIMYTLTNNDKMFDKLVDIHKDGYALLKTIHRKEIKDELNERDLTLIAKGLKKLHTKESYDFLPSFDIDNIITNLYKNKLINKRTLNKYLKQFNNIKEKEKLVISHNNLIKQNILFGYDDIVFTSLFDMGLNIIQYDLASVIDTYNLNDDQIDFFLKQYFGKKYTLLKKKKVLTIKDNILTLIKNKTN